MIVYLLRHGATPGNLLRRYIGSTDEPLSREGVLQARAVQYDIPCERVFVSPMYRARQTAGLLFPEAEQVAVPDFREMDFGDFENRSAEEMANDPAYRAWVDGGCAERCPRGERRGEFSDRVCGAFAALAERLRQEGAETAVIVAHGGTVMSILERFAEPKRDYYSYWVPNCGGFRCVLPEGPGIVLRELEKQGGSE